MTTSRDSTLQLEQLRRTIQSLESYQLPDHYYYLDSAAIAANDNPAARLEQTVQQRYINAKQRYIRQRFEELLVQHVTTYNGETFQIPQKQVEEEAMTNRKRQELQGLLLAHVSSIVQKRNEVLLKYTTLQERKEELKSLAEDLATKTDNDDDEEDDDDEEEDITEEELKEQQHQMEHLLSRKLELQAKLSALQMEAKHLETDNQKLLVEYNCLNNNDESIPLLTNDHDVSNIQSSMVQLQGKIKEGEEKIQELQELVDWYDAMRSTLNELSGIKVLNVSSAATSTNIDEDGNKPIMLVILIQLLDEYTLQVELQTSTKRKIMSSSSSQHFRVAQAVLRGDLLLGEGVTQSRIPPLDDLVAISQQLPEHEDLRFILREAIARIRAVRCRVEELVILRKNYAMTNEGDKLYCSLNEGVTAVLRLGADCPMLKGSAFVEQLIGTGGWDAEELENVRSKLNSGYCKGAVQVMDALVAEIKSIGYQQKTPLLPLREMR